MPCRLRLVFFVVLSAALFALAMEAHAASAPGGIDTPQGTITLPFSIQDNTEMTLGESGLGIGVGTTAPMNLTVSGVVGIGTTAPTDKLQIYDGRLQLATDTTGGSLILSEYAGLARLTAAAADGGGTVAIGREPVTVQGQAVGTYTVELWSGSNGGTSPTVEVTGGNVGFGTTNPSGRIDSETGGANLWAGMFNYNSNNPSGCCGVWACGTSYGVYGQTTGGQAVQGYASSGWGGYFSGGYGVYAQDSSGYWTELGNGGWGLLTNGSVYVGDGGGAQLCLNGQCVTSLSNTGNVTVYSGITGSANLGTHEFCAMMSYACTSDCNAGISVGGSPGSYSWSAWHQNGYTNINVVCLN